MELHRINRRLFLRESARRTVAIAVVGSGTLAACSSDGEITSVADDTTTTSGASTESTTTAAATTESTTTAPPDTTEPLPPLEWERVLLGNVSAYVLLRDREVAIVDTGNPGSEDAIGEALSALSASYDDVGHVVLTHLHSDHVGSLPAVLERAPDAVAWAGEADIDDIDSPRPISPLNDGDEVFGLEVIATPGHTPGHISVLDPQAGFLVAGDALIGGGGMVLGPNERFSSNFTEAKASVRRLAERQFETVVFGHGDPFEGGASDAVVALAQTL